MKKQNNFKKGGVSMFIVIVTCVLVALLTASFVRMVNRDLSNASRQDLSQSAYDSAQAGVEDAKRFVRIWNTDCRSGFDTGTDRCARMNAALERNTCNTLNSAGIGAETGETRIQTTSGTGINNDLALDQAYTCVRIQANTPDFLGVIADGSSKNVPLRAVGGFNQVEISWYSERDLTQPNNTNVNLPAPDGGRYSLPSKEEWNRAVHRPPVMKAQFMGYTGGGLAALDDGVFAVNGNGLNERIYYPTTFGNRTDTLPIARRTGDGASTNDLTAVRCKNNIAGGGYACVTTVNLRHTVAQGNIAFLRLTPIYSGVNFKVRLLNNGEYVNFNGVQPIVDSTGRANDRMRRVESRIESEDLDFPIPEFAVQVDGDNQLCKDFWVTNSRTNLGSDTNAC